MKQLYEITIKGNDKILKGIALTDLKDKNDMCYKILKKHDIPLKEMHKYRIQDIKLMVPDSWIEIEDKGIEVN